MMRRAVPRLPDFIVIGFKKCGTTSVAQRLGEQPGVYVSRPKELDFFDLDANWSKGIDWYSHFFVDASQEHVTGELSTGYTHPGAADRGR